MSKDMMALRGWVTAADHLNYAGMAEGTVMLSCTHSNLKQRIIELRFDMHSTIRSVKEKLYTHNGTNIDYQELHLKKDGVLVAKMLDDTKKLGFYGPENGMEVFVLDKDPLSLSRGGGLEDVSLCKKYEMSEEDYDKRKGTLREYKRKMLEKDPKFKFFPKGMGGGMGMGGGGGGGGGDGDGETESKKIDYESKELIEGIEAGKRCEVEPGKRRGEVMFVGEVPGCGTGYWVGVRFDEPVGKGDGSRAGKTYFDAAPKYGGFIRPNKVTVGDFPERDLLDDSDSDEDEL